LSSALVSLFEIAVRFTVSPPRDKPLHAALLTLRTLVIEAPTSEAAEHYASELRDALERESDR
jgi:hypothetical protein